MSAYPKFMFDFDLGPEHPEAEAEPEAKAAPEEEAEAEPEVIEPTFSEEELKEARQQGFEEGKELGIREASEAMECKINDALEHIKQQFEDIFRHQKQSNAEVFQDAIEVAVGLVKKCFPGLNERAGVTEIENMMTELLAQIIDQPRVQIFIHPELIDALQQRLDSIQQGTHFEGRIVLVEDDENEPGDCRIEWQDGGGERNMQDLWLQVDGIVARTFQGGRDEDSQTSADETPETDPVNSETGDALDQTEQTDATETAPEINPETSPGIEDNNITDQDVSQQTADAETADAETGMSAEDIKDDTGENISAVDNTEVVEAAADQAILDQPEEKKEEAQTDPQQHSDNGDNDSRDA